MAGLWPKLRDGKWNPATGKIPPSVSEMLDYASAKHVGLLAYDYPSRSYVQDPTWLVKIQNRSVKNGFMPTFRTSNPDITHTVTLQFPPAARRQLQGVFFDNVRPDFTEQIAA